MSQDGTEYVYQNVSLLLEPSEEGTAYVYQNISLSAESRVGAVYGFSSPQYTPEAYVYQNIT